MTQLPLEPAIAQTAALLTHYGFDLKGCSVTELLSQWLARYQIMWVRWAVVEALYQGRYKAVSVEQILNFWFRRGNPLFHFNHDFESLICRKLPRHLTTSSEALVSEAEELRRWSANLVTVNQDLAPTQIIFAGGFRQLPSTETETMDHPPEKTEISAPLTVKLDEIKPELAEQEVKTPEFEIKPLDDPWESHDQDTIIWQDPDVNLEESYDLELEQQILQDLLDTRSNITYQEAVLSSPDLDQEQDQVSELDNGSNAALELSSSAEDELEANLDMFHSPIQDFRPSEDCSGLYRKLKSVIDNNQKQENLVNN